MKQHNSFKNRIKSLLQQWFPVVPSGSQWFSVVPRGRVGVLSPLVPQDLFLFLLYISKPVFDQIKMYIHVKSEDQIKLTLET